MSPKMRKVRAITGPGPRCYFVRWRDDDRRRVRRDGILENTDLTVGVGFGLSTQLSNVDTEILACFARPS